MPLDISDGQDSRARRTKGGADCDPDANCPTQETANESYTQCGTGMNCAGSIGTKITLDCTYGYVENCVNSCASLNYAFAAFDENVCECFEEVNCSEYVYYKESTLYAIGAYSCPGSTVAYTQCEAGNYASYNFGCSGTAYVNSAMVDAYADYALITDTNSCNDFCAGGGYPYSTIYRDAAVAPKGIA
ncbi:MAG: hypothetical protein SGILL_008104, partial [Bacillariaceae sp.]